MEFGVVTSLLGIVEQQLLHKPLHPCLINHTQITLSLKEKLIFLQTYLQESEAEAEKVLHKEIRDVAAEAEDKIESKLSEVYLAGEHTVEGEDLHQILQQVVKDFESVEVKIRDLQVRRLTASIDSSLQLEDIRYENIMIGFKDEIETIKSMLVLNRYSKEREVISIFGRGGAGKSTLARKVYDDPEVANDFGIRVWITVSREFSIREILTGIIGYIVPLTSEISEADTEYLADRLRNILKGQTYLIVMDDIWTTQVWGYLQTCFPDYSKKCQILITTRVMEVAQYASRSRQYICNIRPLTSHESWVLFVNKLMFNEERFPFPELESIGRKIVEKCGGLPLAVVVVAGVLAKLERSPKQWEDFAQKTLMGKESVSVSEIIALSYDNLPSHLRACFLYFGIFPEDSDINVKKLIKLWMAEGFLKPVMYKSLEEVAMESLCDLITRNLVLVEKLSFDRKVKSCRLHDLVRDVCLKKEKEDNTLVVINEYCGDLATTWSGTQQSELGWRWMSCKSRLWPITQSTSSNYTWGKIRSILHFGKGLYLAKCRFIFPFLKLLRVLDLSLIKYCNGVPGEIVNLIHLRYLALTTTGSLYNFEFFKLQSLQTLILRSWREECHLQLPGDILDLPWLRHVHLDKGSSLYLPNLVRENLQTLFWLKVTDWDSKTPDFTRVPNLKELGIYIEGEVTDNALDNLLQLNQLEKLKFEIGRAERFNLPISFPLNIKELTLRNTYLPWEEMDVIGKLPNLTVLKLKDFAFCGSKWEPRDEGFQQLKVLLIAHPDLQHWNANEDHFPVLECLVLRCCWYLKELPCDFAFILTLRSVELIDCCRSLVDSAKMIQEDIRDIGGDIHLRNVLTEDESYQVEIDDVEEKQNMNQDQGRQKIRTRDMKFGKFKAKEKQDHKI